MSDRRGLRGWWLYSWANHSWETTVSGVLIGPWLLALATHGRADNSILLSIGPLHLKAESYPSAVITVAAFVQLLTLPWIGGAIDRFAHRRRWLLASATLGSVAAVLLAATGGSEFATAGVIFIFGTVVYGVSDLIYNSYLPELAEPADRDAVSSRGFASGYLGGGLLLAVNLLFLLLHNKFGMAKLTAVRICFVSAGIWWLGFGIPSINRFAKVARPVSPGTPRAFAVIRQLVGRPQSRRYLLAYLLFSDAITAVIGLASVFITHQLFRDNSAKAATFLFSLILMIQFVAIVGALGFGRLAGRIGAKRAILLSLVVWIAVVFYVYAGLHSKRDAVLAGIAIGIVLGGSQALSRSLFAQLVPVGQEATYFGFFEVSAKGSSWIAPLLFTVVVNSTGSYRQAILSLIVLFIGGAVLLARTDIDRAIAEAHRPVEPG